MSRARPRWRAIGRFLAVQLAIVLLAIAPMLVSVAAGQLGAALGCTVNEAGPHPCPLWGMDIGNTLSTAGVFGWLTLATLPAGAILWLAHILYTLVRLVRTYRQRSGP
ncbi:hypothetical protein S4A8_07235 [Salinisphaera sp. S4-8]|uniref:hypothetical protein n=1 Tax=Salinisphaera sp. S4-8 TaxID=633357 RepID=UPI0033406F4D